jgi:hypothetical protein
LQIFRHGIKEGAQIGILLFDAGHLEQIEKFFHQLIQWHEAKLLRFFYEIEWQIIIYLVQQ